jgi:ribosome recycling factor
VVDENYNFNVNDSVLNDLINVLIKIAKKEPNDIRVSLRKYRNEINKQITK